MNFGDALVKLKAGKRVARDGWNGKGMYIELQRVGLGSKMNVPYLYLVTPHGPSDKSLTLVPWLASQTDLLADDWVEVFA